MSAPPSIRCASASSKPMCTPICRGGCAAIAVHKSWYLRLARAQDDEARRRGAGARRPLRAMRSKPFWSTMREIMPTSGRASGLLVGRQTVSREHRPLGGDFPVQCVRRCNGAGRYGSFAGSHTDVSIPLGMPTRRSRRRAQHALEAGAELRRLNLLRITPAHGGDHRRGVDRAFQKAHPAPELHAIDAELLPAQIETRQPVGFEHALIRDVVDGEDRRDAAEHRMRREDRVQIDRRQARLPVVGVHDRGRLSRAARHIRAPRAPARRSGGRCPDIRTPPDAYSESRS